MTAKEGEIGFAKRVVRELIKKLDSNYGVMKE
jgi:hypothetical protein